MYKVSKLAWQAEEIKALASISRQSASSKSRVVKASGLCFKKMTSSVEEGIFPWV